MMIHLSLGCITSLPLIRIVKKVVRKTDRVEKARYLQML